MPASKILGASWEKYDLKKELIMQDKNVFCPENIWEFNYLMDTIVKVRPDLDIMTVMLAIRKIMRETVAPRLRNKFVSAVMDTIVERQHQLADMLEHANRVPEFAIANLPQSESQYPPVL